MSNYFDDVYADIWKKSSVEYGVDDFVKTEMDYLMAEKPQTAFEVGIGTGYPFAIALKNSGVKVSGCDISAKEVELAKDNLEGLEEEPNIYVGDLCDIDVYEKFDVVYCLRVSWYISKFEQRLEKMIELLNPGGLLVFDFMNIDTVIAKRDLLRWWIKVFPKRAIKNLLGISTGAAPITHYYSKKHFEQFFSTKGMQIVAMKSEDIESNFKWCFCCRKS